MTTYDFSIDDTEGSLTVVRTQEEFDALPQSLKPMDSSETLYCEGREDDPTHRVGPLNNGQFIPFITDDIGTHVCASCHIVEHLSLLGIGTVIEDKMSGVHLVGATYDHLHDHIAELSVFFNGDRHTHTWLNSG